jgi:hypothetical protein
MKKNTLAIILLVFSSIATASDKPATSIVIEGLNGYSKAGASAAIETWMKGSGLEGSKEALSQANVLRQVEDYYGKYEGYEIIKDNKISGRSHMVVFVINYEKGPLFGRFQSYLSNSGKWVATEFKFHTEAALVLPKNIVYGE